MNKLLICGALLGFISVLMGALGDHVFHIDDDQTESLATAIRYNMLYAILITALAIQPKKYLIQAAALFTAGTVIFCFSIYLSLATSISELTYATPIGGLLLMGSWLFVAFKTWQNQTS